METQSHIKPVYQKQKWAKRLPLSHSLPDTVQLQTCILSSAMLQEGWEGRRCSSPCQLSPSVQFALPTVAAPVMDQTVCPLDFAALFMLLVFLSRPPGSGRDTESLKK